MLISYYHLFFSHFVAQEAYNICYLGGQQLAFMNYKVLYKGYLLASVLYYNVITSCWLTWSMNLESFNLSINKIYGENVSLWLLSRSGDQHSVDLIIADSETLHTIIVDYLLFLLFRGSCITKECIAPRTAISSSFYIKKLSYCWDLSTHCITHYAH